MPVIDPNIITSGNRMAAPQLPDVNAMMQTRISGLENMATMDRQRAADAQAAQKAQADQQLKAVLPAIAAAFADPSDAGLDAALAMVPPEYADAAQAQMDQLRAIPDVGQRKNIIRAALAQDDMGRSIITQLEPSAGARLQGGLEQQRIDLERAKFAQQQAAATDAAGNVMDPKVKTKLDQAYPKAVQALQNAITGLDQDIADVQALINDPGLKDISGLYGSMAWNVGRDARRAQGLFDKIKAGAGFAALQAMRNASPTGGAIGNVSNQEGEKLEKSVAAFAQNQDYQDLRRVLIGYLADLQTAKDNVQTAFDDTYSYRGGISAAPVAPPPRPQTTETLPQPRSAPAARFPGVVVRRKE